MSLRHPINRAALALTLTAHLLCFLPPAFPQVQQSAPANSKNVQQALAQAQSQLAHGKLDDAETSLWTVLTANSSDEKALTLLGTIRSRQQRYTEAEALFRRILQINVNSLAAHRGL